MKKWNNLKSPSISARQKLRVASQDAMSKDKDEAVEVPDTIVVAKGETLYSISRRYGMSVADLMEINSLESSNIHFGDVLKLK